MNAASPQGRGPAEQLALTETTTSPGSVTGPIAPSDTALDVVRDAGGRAAVLDVLAHLTAAGGSVPWARRALRCAELRGVLEVHAGVVVEVKR